LDNDLQQFARQYMDRQNNRPIPEFEGYSPNEMQYLLHDPFGPDSPLKLNVLDEADYRLIPMLNMIRYLGERLKKTGEMKLTAKGFLPVKIVADLYEQGFYKEEMIESGIVKLYKQTDSHSIDLAGKLSDIAGLTKKRNNKLSLTKNGEKLLGNNAELLRQLLLTFGYKFNWAYYDRYESEKSAKSVLHFPWFCSNVTEIKSDGILSTLKSTSGLFRICTRAGMPRLKSKKIHGTPPAIVILFEHSSGFYICSVWSKSKQRKYP